MKFRKLSFGFLILLLVTVFSGFSASVTNASLARADEAERLAVETATWQQVNEDGFGELDAGEVSALAVFNSYLYAGTINPTDGARIFRSPDGITWTPVILPGFGNDHDTRPPAILDMLVFNGRLYASTGRGDGPAQIWRTVNGVNWAPMTMTGFSNPDTVDFTPFAEYGGWIYSGAANLISGAQVWRSQFGDNNTWTKVFPSGLQAAAGGLTGMSVFNGGLYAAIDSESTAQIWCNDAGSWTAVMNNGFGDPAATSTGGMAVFGNYLYVGAGHQAAGAQLWRSSNGTAWEQVIAPGLGDANNQKVELVFVFENMLYLGVQNPLTGIEIWRSPDGTTWEQSNADGFGDLDNAGTNGSNAVAEFLGDLYVGTVNGVDGGELWRLEGQTPPSPTPPTPTQPTPTQPTPTQPTPTPPPIYQYLPFTLRWP